MDIRSDEGFSMEDRPEMPEEDAFRLLNSTQSAKAARNTALVKSVGRVRELSAKYRTALESVISRDKQARLRDFVESEKRSFAERMFTGAEKQLANAEIAKIMTERAAKGAQFMQRSGIDAAALAKVQKDFRKAFERAFKPEVPMYEGKPVRVLLPGEIPQAVREGKLNPWVVKVAPASSWAWWYDGWTDGFGFDPTLHLDRAAAYVGNTSYLHDGDASDWDAALIDFETRVGWWYQMPSAGLLEVWVEMQPSECLHYLSLHNEWGWSDSFISQYCYATFRVSGGTYGTSTASYHWWDGYTSDHWSIRHLTPGSSYWFHFFSKEAYAKDVWVRPEAGMMSHHYAYANDVSVYSSMDFRFHIKKMYVRVAP